MCFSNVERAYIIVMNDAGLRRKMDEENQLHFAIPANKDKALDKVITINKVNCYFCKFYGIL